MLFEYLPVIVMVIFSFLMGGLFLVLAKWLGSRRSTKTKGSVYESGVLPFSSARQRFSIKYYMIAVSFIVFDIEVVFLYPWAVYLRDMSPKAFIAMLIFVFILFIGWLWEYKKGGLEWD
ncbi:MAG: NADH-quinone oxidoreductase subunit A [Bacteroidetes bacterium]|nr:NADH-quinone oxidoreductase subunit A [Bacteroidota bacterium]